MSKEKFEHASWNVAGGRSAAVRPRQSPADPPSNQPTSSVTGSNTTPPPSSPSSPSSPTSSGGSSTSSSSSSSSSSPSSSSSLTGSSSSPTQSPSSSTSTGPSNTASSNSLPPTSNSSPTAAPTSTSNASSQLVSTSFFVTVVTTNAQGSTITTTSTSSSLVSIPTNHTNSDASSGNPPTATIVGATVGGVVGLILLALVIAFCVRRKRNSWKDEFDGNFDPDRTTSAPTLYSASQYRDDPEPPAPSLGRPSRDELRQTSYQQPVSLGPTGDLGAVHVEPFVLPGRGGVSPPLPSPPGTGSAALPYPQQQSYLDPRSGPPFVPTQIQQPHLQPQGYYQQHSQQYRPAHNASLSASTVTHYTGSSDAGSRVHLLDSAAVGAGTAAGLSAARRSKEREAFSGSRTASTTTSGASAQSSCPPSTPTVSVGDASGPSALQQFGLTSASGKQTQAYPNDNRYVIANPNSPPSPPLPTGSPVPTPQLGSGTGPLRVTNPSRQDSGNSVARPDSPSASSGVLVHRDGGRVLNLDEIPPTYDSIGK